MTENTEIKNKITATNTRPSSSSSHATLEEHTAFGGQDLPEREAFSGQAAGQEQLENLKPKSVSFRESSQNINLTKRIKTGLLGLTLISLLALILWPILSSKENGFTLAVTTLPKKDEAAKFVNVEYHAIDSNGNPVHISAESAHQKSRGDVDFHIINLSVEAVLSTGESIKIKAAKGVYLKEDRKIQFQGKVHILAGSDYNIKTDEAIFMIDEKIAYGGDNTSGTAPFGNFTSDGFHIDMEKEIISLKGKVETNFNPREFQKRNNQEAISKSSPSSSNTIKNSN